MEKQGIRIKRKSAIKNLLALLLIATCGNMQAQTYYFWSNNGGTGNNEFQNTNNWSVGANNNYTSITGPASSFPSGANDLVIFDGNVTSSDCSLLFPASSATFNNILLNASYTGTVDLSNFSSLQVNASMEVNGGALVTPSDSLYLGLTGAVALSIGSGGRLVVSPNSNLSFVSGGNFSKAGSLVADNAMIRLGGSFSNGSGSLSTVGTTICFSGSGPQSVLGNGTALTIKNLKINNTGTKTLSQNNAMTVTDVVEISSGTLNANNKLILASTNNKTARIAPITSGSITGSVTTHNFIPSRATRWTTLGANGVAGQTIGTWDGSGTQQFPITCSDCLYTPAMAAGFASIQGWDEGVPLASGFNTVVSVNDALSPGKGYWVYLGDGAPGATSSAFDLVYTGTVVQGSVTVGITNNDNSWNLIANPYPSPISSSAFLAANTLSGAAVYVWNGSSYLTNPTDIQAGQAFYVQALSNGNVSFTENMKSTANNTNILVKPLNNQKSFDLELRSLDYTDNTNIKVDGNATQNYDTQYDAHKLYSALDYSGYANKYTSIATLSQDGDTCVINTMPMLTDSLSIPVVARVTGTGSYTLGLNNISNMNACIMLFDKVTGQYHDLRLSDYVCNIADTTSAARFNLLLCEDFQMVSVNELNVTNAVLINQNAQGAYVETSFEKDTKAVISAYNIMGQKIMEDITVNGAVNTTYLPLNASNQVVFVKVASNSGIVSKKMLLH